MLAGPPYETRGGLQKRNTFVGFPCGWRDGWSMLIHLRHLGGSDSYGMQKLRGFRINLQSMNPWFDDWRYCIFYLSNMVYICVKFITIDRNWMWYQMEITATHRRVESCSGCDYILLCLFLQGLDPWPAISFQKKSRSHMSKLHQESIENPNSKLFGNKREIAWLEDVNVHPYWGYLYIRCRACILPCLAGTLWPEGSSGLSWFPHWFRHQTHQGRVWIPRWVESTQKSRPHEKTWDAQNEEKTKFPTSIVFFCLVCCLVF